LAGNQLVPTRPPIAPNKPAKNPASLHPPQRIDRRGVRRGIVQVRELDLILRKDPADRVPVVLLGHDKALPVRCDHAGHPNGFLGAVDGEKKLARKDPVLLVGHDELHRGIGIIRKPGALIIAFHGTGPGAGQVRDHRRSDRGLDSRS
jgi:hypothetical protein